MKPARLPAYLPVSCCCRGNAASYPRVRFGGVNALTTQYVQYWQFLCVDGSTYYFRQSKHDAYPERQMRIKFTGHREFCFPHFSPGCQNLLPRCIQLQVDGALLPVCGFVYRSCRVLLLLDQDYRKIC